MDDSAGRVSLLIARKARAHPLVASFMCTVAVMSAGAVGAAAPLPASAAVVRSAAAGHDASVVELSLGLDRPPRRLIQWERNNEGFDAGARDGLFGPRTRTAIGRWQEARRLPVPGYLDGAQAELLRPAALPPLGAAEPVVLPLPAVEATVAPRCPASRAVPAAAEADASAAELLRAAGGPTPHVSDAEATGVPTVQPVSL